VTIAAEDLRERIRALPGMDRLLPALEGLPPAFLVGGAVRDLLLDLESIDIDMAMEGDARAAARELAARLGGTCHPHERFGTATVRAPDLHVDMATTRTERYPSPGALPEVEAAPLDQDLVRRDFTINAMAVALTGDELGHLVDPHGGVTDLEARQVRVLHDASFSDDPTRLIRALRYEARLAFRMDADTEGLAREAIKAEALDTVSGVRKRDELLRLLAEVEMAAAVARMSELALDRALHPALRADAELVAGAALAAGEMAADRVLTALAALVQPAAWELEDWVDSLQLTRGERDRVLRAARVAETLLAPLRRRPAPRELYDLLIYEPPESLALALALGAPAEPVLEFVRDLRTVQLEVTGDELIAAGVPQSPAIGRALAETLRLKLEGSVSGRDEELETALALARQVADE
jgi:tRNA nucleotidyltransferase (CCA-adding enzyme)